MNHRETVITLVSNRAYFEKALLTIWQIRIFGLYTGDIVLIVGNDLVTAIPAIRRSFLRITPVYFSDINRDKENLLLTQLPNTLDSQIKKSFQFHKFYCFSSFFKQWRKVLYVDVRMKIHAPLTKIFQINCSNSLVAHSDAYPDYVWTLTNQFNFTDFPDLFSEISAIANLEADYFQTTMMYFDTSIIDEETVEELISLSRRFPNSRLNDQGIINLWAQPKSVWVKLPTERHGRRFLYDFHEREGCDANDYIMLKYPRTSHKGFLWLVGAKAFTVFRNLERRRIGL